MLDKLKKLTNNISITRFALIASLLNFVLFHYPFFDFVFRHVDYKSLNGILIIACLIILVVIANAFVFYILCYISRYVGKTLLVIFFILNSIALYFVNTYNVIVDESMMGNVFNTNTSETFSSH